VDKVFGTHRAIEKHLIPAIGGHRLRALECEHVEDMLAAVA